MENNRITEYIQENSYLSPYSSNVNKIKRENPARQYKYLDVWQRVRFKLKAKFIILKLLNASINLNNERLDVISESMIEEKFPFAIFHPESNFKTYWSLLIMISMIYLVLIMPFVVAFYDENDFSIYAYIDLIIDIIFFIDFLMICSTAYYDSSGTLILSRKKILWNYLKTWMIIDIISFIPFDIIWMYHSDDSNANLNRFIRFIRLPRLYKLLRFSRFLKLLGSKRHNSLLEKIADYFSLNLSKTRFIKSIITILISVHIVSCLWYISAKLNNFNVDTWVVRSNMQDSNTATLYITCLYWSFTTFSAVGYGDITPKTYLEKSLSITWSLYSLYFFGLIIGSLYSVLNKINTKKKGLIIKLALIDEFVSDSGLSKSLAYKLKHALKYSNKITGFSWTDKQSVLDELPKTLRYELCIAMHNGAAKNIVFFANKDFVIVSAIIPYLTPSFTFVNEFIYRENDLPDEIYFIVKGCVNYIFLDNFIISVIKRSDYFGDIEVVFGIPRKYSALSVANSELLAMNKKLLRKIKEEYACIWEEIKNKAIDRDRRNSTAIIKGKERIKCRIKRSFRGTKILTEFYEKKKITYNEISEKLIFLYEIAEDIKKKIAKAEALIKFSNDQDRNNKFNI